MDEVLIQQEKFPHFDVSCCKHNYIIEDMDINIRNRIDLKVVAGEHRTSVARLALPLTDSRVVVYC